MRWIKAKCHFWTRKKGKNRSDQEELTGEDKSQATTRFVPPPLGILLLRRPTDYHQGQIRDAVTWWYKLFGLRCLSIGYLHEGLAKVQQQKYFVCQSPNSNVESYKINLDLLWPSLASPLIAVEISTLFNCKNQLRRVSCPSGVNLFLPDSPIHSLRNNK